MAKSTQTGKRVDYAHLKRQISISIATNGSSVSPGVLVTCVLGAEHREDKDDQISVGRYR